MATYEDYAGTGTTVVHRPGVSSSYAHQQLNAANGIEPANQALESTPLLSPGQQSKWSLIVGAISARCCCGSHSRWRARCSLFVLATINLLNYMDRYTLAGVLTDVQKFYGINNSESGFLQSSFVISYMVFSMLFGYLGDRFNRKLIMACGIFFWSGITLASSFVGKSYFTWFIITRALVGVGEASYSTIAPTVLADLFVSDARTLAYAIFYFAIPVGSGLGYIVGSKVAEALDSWQWALRVTPCFGFVCFFLLLTVVREPPRGEAEGGSNLVATSYFSDIKYLLHNKSFLLSTFGFTCVAFVTGALAFWAPAFMSKAVVIQKLNIADAQLSMYFGVITCVAGLAGVTIGTKAASKLRPITHDADPLVCAVGLIAGTPFLFIALVISRYNMIVTWLSIFVAETLLFFNWALITDILMYVVIPTRRSTAEAVQILVSHMLGDASSPYLIGMISDNLRQNSGISDFASLQYALYITSFVCALGSAFFFATTLYVHQDRIAASQFVIQSVNDQPTSDEEDRDMLDGGHHVTRDNRDAVAI